ncbi:MAG TPA: EAL domain-containing protein, partial [Anaerolineales bacterium]|nr:EAL domain-containing protein [Anaerolineales bacterium]
DRSFISDVISDPDDAAITSAIIAMAHVLKLNVVAEGVETEMQLEFLKSQQCDHIQGYLISHAQPVEEITHLLRKYCGARQKQNLTSLGYLSPSNSQVKLT